jgi:hypothetical protein
MRLGDLPFRMQWIAVAGEGADLHAPGGDCVQQPLASSLIGEQRGGVRMGIARVAANANLDGLAAGGFHVIERLLERALAEQDGEDPDFHVRAISFDDSPGPLPDPGHRGRATSGARLSRQSRHEDAGALVVPRSYRRNDRYLRCCASS